MAFKLVAEGPHVHGGIFQVSSGRALEHCGCWRASESDTHFHVEVAVARHFLQRSEWKGISGLPTWLRAEPLHGKREWKICFAPRSTLDVREINWRATKERPTDRKPRDNRAGGVDMWDRSVRFPCVFLKGRLIGWVTASVGWLGTRAGPRDPPLS